MSAKILIKKEDLIKGTIKIIRSKGIEELSARNLAKVCNCSTQPIFRLFKNMEDLKNTVYNDVNQIQKTYTDFVEIIKFPIYNKILLSATYIVNNKIEHKCKKTCKEYTSCTISIKII